jgi:16S rRNA (adenine1518-N6/adenine1519-N6)-dimethyltransferase
MVSAAGVAADDQVLEIGPGLGILTKALLATESTVTTIELDQRLYEYLKKTYIDVKNVHLIRGDVFKVNLNELFSDGEYALVANLPYSATSLIFRNFLTLKPRPKSLTVMVQRDVAERIVAKPGEMSVLALMVQRYSTPSLLFDVLPNQFYPEPKVVSSVLHLDVHLDIDPSGDKRLWRTVKAGFSARRKQLRNTLNASLGLDFDTIDQRFSELGLDPKVRAQELTLENWLRLAKE